MLLTVILLMLAVSGGANDVTRDFFGDIFRMRDCHNGSRCDNGGRRAALQVPGRPCYCQCAPSHLAYREDKQQCVKDIKECYMSVFYRPFSIEAIPLVYLPTSGQLVHPDAHLSLSMRRNLEGGMAKCRVSVSQYLTREGWRTITKMDGTGGSVFGLFTDANKTYLQFLGTSQDRKLLQQHMILIRLLCIIPQYPAFETCVAIRIGWVPGVENLDAPSPSNKANMMVVGLSLGVLALVYIFAVLVYLKIRRQMIAKQKANTDQEAKLQNRDENSDKASTLHRMEPSKRLELYHTASLGRIKPSKKGYQNNSDPWNQMSPIIETYNRTWTDRMGQHSSEFRAQDFKLQPEFFEPEFMASPPHEVLEYLERLQNSITFARHRMRSCYRYQPTLNGIPEDDYFYQELEKKEAQDKNLRTTPDGGSASSVGSLQESSEEKNSAENRELPKVPPRKPKRKIIKDKPECRTENPQGSDQEQKEIQKAMNTLNDTLNALEYDMYKQEYLNQTSDTETGNLSCQNSTSIDFDDFETSSCSSTSAVTILGRDAKRQSDISKCSPYMEKNQSEDISTFSNSTYSLCDAMHGLFHDGNKAIHNIESEKSNFSSRCSSRTGYVSHPDENSNYGLERSQTSTDNTEGNNPPKKTNTDESVQSNINFSSHSDKNNILEENDTAIPNAIENGETSNQESKLKDTASFNCSEDRIKNRTLNRKHTYFSMPNQDCFQRKTPDHIKNCQENRPSQMSEINSCRRASTPDKTNELSKSNMTTPENKQRHFNSLMYKENERSNTKNSYQGEHNHNNLKSSDHLCNEFSNSKNPKPEIVKTAKNKAPKVPSAENVKIPNGGEIRSWNSKSANFQNYSSKNAAISNPEHLKAKMSNSLKSPDSNIENTLLSLEMGHSNSKSPIPPNSENGTKVSHSQINVGNVKPRTPTSLENERMNCNTPNNSNGHVNKLPSHHENKHKNSNLPVEEENKNSNALATDSNHKSNWTANVENCDVRAKSPNNDHLKMNSLNSSRRTRKQGTLDAEENENKSSSDSDSRCQTLRRSNSTESMNTIATDMTVDSLDSRCATPSHPSPTPSLMEMWINKLVATSVPYSKNSRKSKKKLVLPEDEIENWEHVCQKHKEPCPMHELNSSEPNLIDKLAHYSSKTMAGCDVAGYFQSLKQDVLKEHLKQWLTSNNQSKRHKKAISLEYSNECSHKKPLVNGQVNNLVDDTGMHFSNNNYSETELNEVWNKGHDASIIDDSLESNSAKKLKENGNIHFKGHSDNNEQTVQN